jgi:hypothetical protein
VGKFTGKTHTETMNRRSYTINEQKLIVKGVARWGLHWDQILADQELALRTTRPGLTSNALQKKWTSMVQKNDVLVGFGMNDPIPLDFQIPEVEEVPPIQPQPQGDEVPAVPPIQPQGDE